ncbi:MAG TPA: MoaD/ThiS family protein [Cellvibrionaceae bacterium]|nr:MoaD/ThiS family protein [Cellvibrionaceae bacterium]HNG58546.1 MoaD/ThiS family protein [Cellvibrionaceae bacterium]
MNLAFSGTLLRFVNFQKNLHIEADSIEDALKKLANDYPQSAGVLFDDAGQVRKVHQLFLNGKQVDPAQLSSPVKDSDRLDVLTAIAGG